MDRTEAARRLRHDLGKYVCFDARWLPDEPSDDALRAALENDLLRTRRGPAGALTAAQVWAEQRDGVCDAPGFAELDAAMGRLTTAAAGLAAADTTTLRATAALARDVAEQIRSLTRALGA